MQSNQKAMWKFYSRNREFFDELWMWINIVSSDFLCINFRRYIRLSMDYNMDTYELLVIKDFTYNSWH